MKYYLLVFAICLVKDLVATLQIILISKLSYYSVVTAALTTLMSWALTVFLIIRDDRVEIIMAMVAADIVATALGIALVRYGRTRK
jgi:hypothetical protein